MLRRNLPPDKRRRASERIMNKKYHYGENTSQGLERAYHGRLNIVGGVSGELGDMMRHGWG